jgi:hypothetical protein
MPEKHLFEYAVLRVVPRVEREEFINVGVILYCQKLKFLQVVYQLNGQRLKYLCPDLDSTEVEAYLHAFKKISEGKEESGPIGKLDVASRFRWLTAHRSTVIQTSRVHPGFCTDAQETLLRLYQQFVL